MPVTAAMEFGRREQLERIQNMRFKRIEMVSNTMMSAWFGVWLQPEERELRSRLNLEFTVLSIYSIFWIYSAVDLQVGIGLVC